MTCAWQELLSILPPWLSREADRLGKADLQELRLRERHGAQLVCPAKVWETERKVTQDDLNFTVNTASRYSPWAAQSMAKGYLTAPGGHRIGVCGEAVLKDSRMTGFRAVSSLCIRVARDFPGIGAEVSKLRGSILLIGPPGSGKTTLLRDVIREISEREFVAVVDERGEIFPKGFDRGKQVDVLEGCSKIDGIHMLLRTMGPETIAVDEISEESDCKALRRALWCGVRLIATAHAASAEDLRKNVVYAPLVQGGLFEHILVLRRDKAWREERMTL